MKEETGKELDAVAMLTESVAELTVAVKIQNDVMLVLLHTLDLKIPDWKDKADIEKEVRPKIEACIEAMRRVYERSETDKS